MAISTDRNIPHSKWNQTVENIYETPNRNKQLWSKSNGDPVWGTISILLGVSSLILQLIP